MDEKEWGKSRLPPAMLGYLVQQDGEPGTTIHRCSDRKIRLFAVACCRSYFHLLVDPRSRHAVEEAERFVDGKSSHAGLRAACDDAQEADHAPFPRNLGDRRGAATAASWSAAPMCLDAAHGVLRHLPDPERQADLLRSIASNPFRKAFIPFDAGEYVAKGRNPRWGYRPYCSWLTPTVRSLAWAAYEERMDDGSLDPQRLGVLSDALEEAGCEDEELLRSLRGFDRCPECPGTGSVDMGLADGYCDNCSDRVFVEGGWYWKGNGWARAGKRFRGLWSLDLLLGKE